MALHSPRNKVPSFVRCRTCGAPSIFLSFNDGKKRTQVRCKVCASLSQVSQRLRKPTQYLCPHCGHPLYLWKQRTDCSLYKCDRDDCPHYLANKNKLNKAERLLFLIKSSQFKLRYSYAECHFKEEDLVVSAPPRHDIAALGSIRNTLHTLSLVLTFHISLGLSARKTAFVLRHVFSVTASYQTVLNYSQMAAYYCHKFNLANKGTADTTQAGDEASIKVAGKNAYAFFFISPSRRKITSYHCAPNREARPATIALREALRTVPDDADIRIITDGNPSYIAGIHFCNRNRENPYQHRQVIGLQNLDQESETYRPFKQLIERLIRSYRFHTYAACGFKEFAGAIALTVLFVTHYNFLRPHQSLDYEVPCPLPLLQNIRTLQGKWAAVLRTASSLA